MGHCYVVADAGVVGVDFGLNTDEEGLSHTLN